MSESLNQNFNHLKVHTQYSICEGAAKIDDLQEYCKSNKIKSLGISDTSNLCGALEFAEKISKSGTQPIIGTQINFKYGDYIGLLPLFALNEEGYKRIIKLSSISFLENDELDSPFLLQAEENGLLNLKGHRSVGGMRASIYNAMPLEGVEELIKYMKYFESKYG